MGLTLSENGGGDFTPVAEGTHIARCVRVIDLGLQPGSQQFPDAKMKVLFVWELPTEMTEIDGELRPSLLMSRYTASLHKKSGLRGDLESWRGRAFTEAELKGFGLKAVLDVPCMITVVHSADGKYANVRSIAKMPRGIPCPPRISELLYYEIEDGHNAVYHKLSEKLRATIDIGAGARPASPQPQHAAAPAPYDNTHQRNGQIKATIAAAAPVHDHDDYSDESGVPF